jgi:rRNA-processing protein FCF1
MASTGEKVIALDTNMLLSIEQFKVDALGQMKALEGKASFVLPYQVWHELQGLKKQSKTLERRAKIAEEVVRKRKVKKVRVLAANADKALVKLAEKGAIVATNDRELKKEVKKVNGSIMFLRQKRFIVKE